MIAALGAAAVALPASAAASAPRSEPSPIGPGPTTRVPVTVGPAVIHPTTDVVLRFVQPVAVGASATLRTSETIAIAGPDRSRCIDTARVEVSPADIGTHVRRTLRPGVFGHPWCTGVYRGLVTVSTSANCPPGPVTSVAGDVCPLFITAPRTIAAFRFRVVAA